MIGTIGIDEVPTNWDDPAWCYKCHRDIAFCLCICYVCHELLEYCECTCALCDTEVQGGGLCATHKATWDEAVQGPEPDKTDEVGKCAKCGRPFNRAFLLNAPSHPRIQCTSYITDRTACIRCDPDHTGAPLRYD